MVLIDEYDAPLTHLLGRNLDPEPFISVLREFFGRLKHNEDRLILFSSRASVALLT